MLRHNTNHLTFSDGRSAPNSSNFPTLPWESSLLIFDLEQRDVMKGPRPRLPGNKGSTGLLPVLWAAFRNSCIGSEVEHWVAATASYEPAQKASVSRVFPNVRAPSTSKIKNMKGFQGDWRDNEDKKQFPTSFFSCLLSPSLKLRILFGNNWLVYLEQESQAEAWTSAVLLFNYK